MIEPRHADGLIDALRRPLTQPAITVAAYQPALRRGFHGSCRIDVAGQACCSLQPGGLARQFLPLNLGLTDHRSLRDGTPIVNGVPSPNERPAGSEALIIHCASRSDQPSTSAQIASSTVAFSGNSETPTEMRVCLPASPNNSTSRCEAPLTTRA